MKMPSLEELMENPTFIAKVNRMATPSGYAEERLGMKLHPKQAEILEDLFSRRGSRVVSRCANEVGKTRKVLTAAVLFAADVLDCNVVTTAGTYQQIVGQLIPSLKSFSHLYDPKKWEFLESSIKKKNERTGVWEVVYNGVSTKDEHYFQGYHRDEGRELFIAVDEAQGVPSEIIRAAEDRCNPTFFLLTGSPGDPAGAFYEAETSKASHYTHHKINRMECLTTNGYWLDPVTIQRLVDKHGQDNPFIQSTVYGEFSQIVENALISLGEYERCMEYPCVQRNGDCHVFCDFAAGRDKNVIACRIGNRVWIEKKWQDRDTMSAVGQFLATFLKLQKQFGLKPDDISGDADGLGLPMIHRLREVGWPIHEHHGNATPRFEDNYRNLIAEIWASGIQRIRDGSIILPDDPDLKGQILGRKARRNSTGKLELESKEDMKKRGVGSPDEADAVLGCIAPAPRVTSFNLVANTKQDYACQVDWSGDSQGDNEKAERLYFQ